MKSFLTPFLLLGISANILAQVTATIVPQLSKNQGAVNQMQTNRFASRALSFVENKGQVTDQQGNHRQDIDYVLRSKGLSIFIGKGSMSYQFYKTDKKINPLSFKKHLFPTQECVEDTTPAKYEMYRLDMSLEGADIHAKLVPDEQTGYHENYHTVALNSGTGGLSSYGKITYRDIYPDIDWVLYIKDNKLEYDFIVRPGGNVNDIKIKYNGATGIAHTTGNIKIATPMGNITEQQLYVYEQGSCKPIESSFTVHNNTLGFALLSKVKNDATIIIDPQLAWGTYFGDISRDIVIASTCDGNGNVYISGFTESIGNITTTGSYQSSYSGREDVYLAKFNSLGSLLWSTYYGGTNQDVTQSIACDNNGNAYVTGYTRSSNNIATPGAQQTTLIGLENAFVAKFTPTGSLAWATYYCGGGYGVTCDPSGNLYACGGSWCGTNIATPGSFQDTLCGFANASLSKFTGNGNLIWATYFGLSTGSSGALSCACDKEENVYITGMVYDTGIITTPGCYKDTSSGGGHDAYIAKFDSSCHLLWSTYYGGDSVDDPTGIICDDSSNVYITGYTNSSFGIATAGGHQTVSGGGYGDVFLARFSATGMLHWGTYFGGSQNDEGSGIAYDGRGHIYIGGSTVSSNNIATPGSHQETIGGGLDAFIAAFNCSGSLAWASYYGGSINDVGLAMASDGNGSVFISGYTASSNNIGTPNGFQNYYTDSLDGFLAKFVPDNVAVHAVSSVLPKIEILPNPSTGHFVIRVECFDVDIPISVRILNISGQVIYCTSEHSHKGTVNLKIDLSGHAPGAYFVDLTQGAINKRLPVVLQ